MIRRALLLCAMAALGSTLAVAEEAPPSAPPKRAPNEADVALEVFRAHRGGDAAKVAEWAASRRLDPHRVLHLLLGMHVDGSLSDSPHADGVLPAARAYAELATDETRSPGLVGFVDAAGRLSADELRREARLRSGIRDLVAAVDGKRWPDAAALVDRTKEDSAAVPAGLTKAILGYHVGRALEGLRRLDDAARAYLEAAEITSQIGWRGLEARALWRGGFVAIDRGDPQGAVDLWQEERRIELAIGERFDAAGTLQDLGNAFTKLGHLEDALDHYTRAREEWELLGHRAGVAKALDAAAIVLRRLGRASEALEADRETLREWEALGHRHGAAKTLLSIGQDHFRLGEISEALGHFERSRDGFLAISDAVGVARARGCLADVQLQRGEFRKALEAYGSLRDEFTRLGLRSDAALALLNSGIAQGGLGRYAEALESLRRSVEEGKAADEYVVVAGSLAEMSPLLYEQGDGAGAMEAIRSALQVYQTANDRWGVLATEVGLASAHLRGGQFAAAFDLLERSLADAERLRQRGIAASAWNVLGDLHGALGDHDKAVDAYRRALAMQRAQQDRGAAAVTLDNLAMLLGAKGRLLEALDAFREVLAEYEALGNAARIASTQGNLATVHTFLGRYAEAEELSRRAIVGLEAAGSRRAAAQASINVGRALRMGGRPAEALEVLERVLVRLLAVGDHQTASRALWNIGQAQLALGRPADAVETARRLATLRTLLTRGLAERQVHGLLLSVGEATDLGLEAHLALLASGTSDPASVGREAFRFAEASRASVLAEVLRNREALLAATLPPVLRDAEAAARARVRAAQARVIERASQTGNDAGDLVRAQADLDAAYVAQEAAIARLQREAQRVAGVVYPEPADPTRIQRALGPETALILYQITESKAIAVLVEQEGVELVDLGESAGLMAAAEAFVRLVSAGGSDDEGAAAALYERLLRPLETAIGGRTRLLISPDRALAFLPFEALVRRDDARRERALERWEIAYVPSGAIYAALRDEASGVGPGSGLLALADPAYPTEASVKNGLALREIALRGLTSLARLPGTAEEAKGIAALFSPAERTLLLRGDASVEGLAAALGKVEGRLCAVHIACHGHVDAERPSLTGLVLAGGEVLTLDDVYRAKVPADLVVLSACETGKGKLVRGEGVMGLVRGFFFAGAPRVVVSNWKVSDEATRGLMVGFYRNMVKGGLAPAAALRRAKLTVLHAGGAAAHPAHWAAFVLWGLPQ